MEFKDNNDFIEYVNFNDSFKILKNIKNKKEISSNETSVSTSLNTSFISNNSIYQNNIYQRTSKEIFLSYLDKLYHFKIPFTKNNILNKENLIISNKRKYNSIIFFDWDDTLLCSSFLMKYSLFENNNETITNQKYSTIKNLLLKLEEKILKVLSISILLGDTYIITNASEGWVESSAKKYLPNIIKLFKKVKIISARTAYENQFPNDNKLWKLAVFRDIANLYNKNIVTNFICFGDSNIEIDAAVKVSSIFSECYIKTIKLKEDPKIEDMIKQLDLIAKQFNDIHSATRNIFLIVEKKGKCNKK